MSVAGITANSLGVSAKGLGKRYGDFWALQDLNLEVPTGSVLGLLGHNGAGKTTTIRILTTLTEPTTGRAYICGNNVTTEANTVRSRIGVTNQDNTVDDLLTAKANIEMVRRLHHIDTKTVRRRAQELLERLGLSEHGKDVVRTFSGGMRRKLDLAASLVTQPEVLFLDEPTTGLDPRSRNDLWNLLRDLVADGLTLVLTTQYLDEADQLADNIVVLNHGRDVASGTAFELKAKIGGTRLVVTVQSVHELDRAAQVLERFQEKPASKDVENLKLTIPARIDARLIDVVRALDSAGIEAVDVNRRDATLDDVFLTITDSANREEGSV